LALQVVKCLKGIDNVLYEFVPDQLMASGYSRMKLKILGHGQQADFIFITENSEVPLLLNVDIHEMSTEIAGGFVGNTIGVYATSNGQKSDSEAEIFDFRIYNKE
jgi:alpha-N-arabinofuranosidase